MTATFRNNAHLQVDILDIWYSAIQPILNLKGSLPALVFQPISAPIISHFSSNDGNAFGILPQDAPLTRKSSHFLMSSFCSNLWFSEVLTSLHCVVMAIDLQWGDIKDDDEVISIAQGIIDKAVALGKV